MTLRPLDLSKRNHVRAYLALPARLSGDFPDWLPAPQSLVAADLSPNHPYYEHSEAAFFLAGDPLSPTGRIAVLANRNHAAHRHSDAAFFTHFECIDDAAVAAELFHTAAAWAVEKGMGRLIGPVGFLQSDARGMMVAGHGRMSSFALPYSPPYYQALMEGGGFRKHSDYLSGELASDFRLAPRVDRVADRLRERSGIRLRSTHSRKTLRRLAPELFAIYKASGDKAPLYYPTTPAEERLILQRLAQTACPPLIHWIEERGVPCGVHMALPNHAEALRRAGSNRLARTAAFLKQRRRPSEINIAMTYLKPDHQGRGLNLLLYMACQQAALELGCRRALVGPVHEENRTGLSVLEKSGVVFDIVHRLYIKEIP